MDDTYAIETINTLNSATDRIPQSSNYLPLFFIWKPKILNNFDLWTL